MLLPVTLTTLVLVDVKHVHLHPKQPGPAGVRKGSEDKGSLISVEDPCSEPIPFIPACLNWALWLCSQGASFPAKIGLVFQSPFWVSSRV